MTMSHAPGPPAANLQTSKSPLPAEDRRLHPRYHLQLAITLRGDNNFSTGITADISTGGVFIATQHILPVGTPVVMQFHLTRFDADITVAGTVRWIREPEATARGGYVFGGSHFDDVKSGMGVQFHGLSAEDAALIQSFMQVRSPEFFD
jgi:uncharacterized protein (TIGR02266 family)